MNINDEVVVRLTPAGEEAWRRYWLKTSDGVPEVIRTSATLPDGKVRFQIHHLMYTFGPYCYNGSNELPFVNNEIEILEK